MSENASESTKKSPNALSAAEIEAVASRYRRLAGLFTAAVEQVDGTAWERPSPCEGWTARDVVRHVAETQRDLLDRVGLAPDDRELPDDPVAAWDLVRGWVATVLAEPERAGLIYESYFGPTTVAETLDTFYCSDLAIHRWDLARAAGLADHEEMPADEVARLTQDYRKLGESLRSPGVCGPPVELDTPDPTEQDRLLAFLGRQP